MANKRKDQAWGENGFEDWGGYMAAKKAKLEEQFHDEANKEFANVQKIFQEISIFVNGYTDPTAEELRRLMMQYGGTYHHYLRPHITTHIIASNLPYSKIKLYRKSQNPLPICKPQWITDSITTGKLLNYKNYLLYTNHTETQPQLNFQVKENTTDATTVDPDSNRCESINTTMIEDISNDDRNKDYKSKNRAMKGNKNEKIEAPIPFVAQNATHSTRNSEFISEFYNNSRLHHIATMGATFKDYVNELRDKHSGTFVGLDRLVKLKQLQPGPSSKCQSDSEDEILTDTNTCKSISDPIIMHIDMDCFFVSVGLRNKPHLKGLPVAVTHAKGNRHLPNGQFTDADNNIQDNDEHGSMSEIASCSYEARKAGVKNGMFLGQALKLCPNLQTMKYDFEGYKEVSYALYDTISSYTLDIEAVSCDEMYANCTKVLKKSALKPMEFATLIRNEIKEKTNCPVSTGFGNNKLLARLATKRAKPDGQFYLRASEAENYMCLFNVKDLPGVGYSTAQKLSGININTCAELQKISLSILQKDFGKKMGETLFNMCRGIDNSKLNLEHVRKSISAEVNYGIRFQNNGDAVDFLKRLCEEICTRLKKANAMGRSITLKLMVRAKQAPIETEKFMGHGLCDYITKSKNLIAPVDDLAIITKEVVSIWNQLHLLPEDMRGIGIQISRLNIIKHKSKATTLMSYVNKTNQVQRSDRNELIPENKIQLKIDSGKSSKVTKNLTSFFPIQPQELFKEALQNVKDTTRKIFHAESNTFKVASTKSVVTSEITNSSTNLETESDMHIWVPSQDIDNSILEKLPEDIKTEIINIKNKNNKCLVQSETRNLAESTNQNNFLPTKSGTISTTGNAETSRSLEYDKKSCTHELPLPKKPVLESDNKPAFLTPSQEIDEDVLSKLPKDIQTEIIDIMPKRSRPFKNKNSNIIQNAQMCQEDFYKQVKSTSAKLVKVDMPPLQEIDMFVLIELPENIRNEILNEYRANKFQAKSETCPSINKNVTEHGRYISSTLRTANLFDNKNTNEENISFSQVDPEFLAALPADMQEDVQTYCIAKKKENEVKKKQFLYKNQMPENLIGSRAGILKLDKKVNKSSKIRSKNKIKKNSGNKLKTKSARMISKETPSSMQINKVDNRTQSLLNCMGNFKTTLDKVSATDAEAILLHNRSIIDDNQGTDKQQEMLVTLVNHLFQLPVKQVKMQIQTWIANSKSVNEVDFLSLATFLSMLPGKKRIEDLHILLKTMHRCMTKTGSCIWHKTYRKTVKHVQQYMQIEYNSNLMVPPIRCNLLKCNCDDVI